MPQYRSFVSLRFDIIAIASQGGGLVWLNFPTAYSFVMISPNLYAIWVFLLMNLSQDLKCFLLRYFGTLGDG
jgi:hypothetical protein